MFEVLLKPSHPTGVYHRAGMEFNPKTPVKMAVVPQAVKDDSWLIVTTVEETRKEKPVPLRNLEMEKAESRK